jgi:hypothetical protein
LNCDAVATEIQAILQGVPDREDPSEWPCPESRGLGFYTFISAVTGFRPFLEWSWERELSA